LCIKGLTCYDTYCNTEQVVIE